MLTLLHFKLLIVPRVQPLLHVTIGNTNIDTSPVVYNLGVHLDSSLKMTKQINSVCQSSLRALRKISSVRNFLNESTTTKLLHAFVSSRLDYCNSLYYGLPKTETAKLQRVQNTAARIATRTRRHDHITPVLRNLHWLPVQKRVEFKVLLLTFKCRLHNSPSYIKDLIRDRKVKRTLRSSSQQFLSLPRAPATTTYGDAAFIISSPTLWNSLPQNVREASSVSLFKSRLKTHLFVSAFGQI